MKNQKDLYSQLNKNMELDKIQDYIKNVIDIRGFGNQPVEQEVLLLTEEVGELAKAIRKEKQICVLIKVKLKIMIQLKMKLLMYL